ncbi:MAG: hypothetical protein AB1489_11280 [Acidobacteriota bacterium]
MKRELIYTTKKIAVSALIVFTLGLATLFGQSPDYKTMPLPSVNDQRVQLTDNHQHSWDDLRLLLITLVEIDGDLVRWKHQTPFETKMGHWQASQALKKRENGLKSDRIRLGKEYVGIYCIHCETVIWLYDSK